MGFKNLSHKAKHKETHVEGIAPEGHPKAAELAVKDAMQMHKDEYPADKYEYKHAGKPPHHYDEGDEYHDILVRKK